MTGNPTYSFQKVSVGSVETDPTQWDQFNTDELGAAEAVSRESHQNALDAGAGGGPVRTRISLHTANPADGDFFEELFAPLVPHLKACGDRFVPPDVRQPRFLVVEDFGTIGLTGSWDSVDRGNFSDFWRRFGNSHKSGAKGGSWGLGKLAYPGTSRARTFFGVTIRIDDPQPLLMGQTVLKHHEVSGDRFVPFGFYSILAEDGLQLPITDIELIERFSTAVGFRRTNEPGLSIAVPFVPEDLTEAALIQPLLKNYFFPILMGHLEIEVGEVRITKETFAEAVAEYGGEDFADGSLESFIKRLHELLQANSPDAELPATWQYGKVEDALDEAGWKDLRSKLGGGELVHIRVPVKVKAADGASKSGKVDIAFLLGEEGQKPRGLFVRDSLTINAEARQQYRDKIAFAALVAGEGPVAQLLRAAENPAHTEWNPKAQKLGDDWDPDDAAKRVRQIKRLPRQLCDLLVQAAEQRDERALIDFFSIPDQADRDSPETPPASPPPPPIPPIPPTPQAYKLFRRPTGFAIGGSDVEEPGKLRVTVAYDLVRGDPFKAFSSFDFDFLKLDDTGLEIKAGGADLEFVAPNVLQITPHTNEFEVEVLGFDTHRDLRVDVRRVVA